MKRLVLLFAALLVAGCGEKSSSEGSESAGEESSDTPNSLSDADVERLLKEAIDFDSLEERNDLLYQNNESEPFSGWAKSMYDSGQVQGLAQFKDGKMNGLMTAWHENGQKMIEGTFKDGKRDGLRTAWHENGEKLREQTFKDGKQVSEKWWNSKGEEVETEEEADK